MLSEAVRAGGCAEVFDVNLAGKVHENPGVVWEQSHRSHVEAAY
jgi:hypothetical protein